MRSIVSGIVFWGVVAFFLTGFNTACLAGQSLAVGAVDHSMFEDNWAFGAENSTWEVQSKDDGSVSVGKNRVVGRDEVISEVVVLGADLTVLGTVNGDAVCIGGDLTVGPEAVVKGDLVSVGGTLNVDPLAKTYKDRVCIGGFPFGFLRGLSNLDRIKSLENAGPSGLGGADLDITIGSNGFGHRLVRFVMDLVYILLLLFFALLLTMFMPRKFDRIEEHLSTEFPRSLLLGIASMAGTPIVLLAFVISVIGILFIPFFLLALVISCLMGYLVFSRMLGRRLLPGRQIMLQILSGLLLLQGAFVIGDVLLLPGGTLSTIIGHVFRGIGTVVFFCANFIGLGAVLYSLWGKREPASARSEKPEILESSPPAEGAGDTGAGEAKGDVESTEGAGGAEAKEDADAGRAEGAEAGKGTEASEDQPKV